MQFVVHPIWSWPIVAAAWVVLAALAQWTYRQGTPGRRWLLTLRHLAIALAIFGLWRPGVVFSKLIKQTAVLAIVADKSQSMLLRDMWDDQTRHQALVRLWKESADDLAAIEEVVRVRPFHFDRQLGEGILPDNEPTGEQTAIGTALSQLLEKTAGERLAGAILLTDGVNTSGIAPTTMAKQFGAQRVPLHVFGFGRETAGEQIRDVAARSLLANATVFAKNKMTVRGEFQAPGFSGRPITVRLLLDGVEKARGVVTPKGDTKALIDLTAVPETPGDVKVTLEAEPQVGELLPTNNSVSTYVSVLGGGLSVLAIEGKYRYWEPKYLRWALDQSPDIELNQLFLLGADGKVEPIPEGIFAPGRFDVIILGDVPASRFPSDQIRQLATLVQRGAGLLMIGGYESFGPGGWASTPLADVLPVAMRRGDGQLSEPLLLIPTDLGVRHFVLRQAPELKENQAVWQSLRPLDGGSTWGDAKPNAQVLAATPKGLPLLVAQDVGGGRSMVFAGDTTWRWRRDPAGIAAHARFWRQVVLWLAHKEDQLGTVIRVRLAKRRLAVGEKLPIEVKIEDAAGTPITDAQIQAFVTTPDDKRIPVDLFRQGDEYRASFWQSESPGDYSLTVAVNKGGASLGSRQVKFLVHAENVELIQLAADLGALRAMAAASGGDYHSPEDLPKFLRSLKDKKLELEVTQPIAESLWDRWPVFVLFAIALSAEWIERKRRGLP